MVASTLNVSGCLYLFLLCTALERLKATTLIVISWTLRQIKSEEILIQRQRAKKQDLSTEIYKDILNKTRIGRKKTYGGKITVEKILY